MVGTWSSQSGGFLYVMSGVTLLAFGLPMLLVPLEWARTLRWELPEQTHLAIYFGRSLGGVATVLAIFGFRAAAESALQPFFFQLMLCVFAMMIGTHIYGAVRRIQPITETIEIFLWVAFSLLTLSFYPG